VTEHFLQDVSVEAVKELFLHTFGAEKEQTVSAVLERSAHCRLAFASLVDATAPPYHPPAPPTAIISQTHRSSRGRPQTRLWAFWAAFVSAQDLQHAGLEVHHSFSAKLISALINQSVTADEVRKVFVALRKEAVKHATATAKVALETGLKREMTEKQFRRLRREDLEGSLNPDSEMRPMIIGGKVNEEWLDQMVQVRGSILHRVRKQGPLAGDPPEVRVSAATRVVKNLALSSSPASNRVHLGKGFDVEVSTPARLMSKVTLSFPLNGEPYAAAVFSVPQWWSEWEGLFVARPKPGLLGGGSKNLSPSAVPGA
jgi:hypothetical protein